MHPVRKLLQKASSKSWPALRHWTDCGACDGHGRHWHWLFYHKPALERMIKEIYEASPRPHQNQNLHLLAPRWPRQAAFELPPASPARGRALCGEPCATRQQGHAQSHLHTVLFTSVAPWLPSASSYRMLGCLLKSGCRGLRSQRSPSIRISIYCLYSGSSLDGQSELAPTSASGNFGLRRGRGNAVYVADRVLHVRPPF